MSHKVITLVNSRTVGSQPQKAVLANMADKASDGGEGVFASKATIAKETELGLSTVKRAINDLLERGLIREVGQRGCANGHTVVYDLDVRAIAALPAWKNDDVTPSRVDPVQSGRGPERAVTPSRADPHPVQSGPQTILEPSLNQEAIASLENASAQEFEDPPPKKGRRASALPPDWVPSDRNLSDARSKNFTEGEIHEQATAFRDYHLARGTTFKDWDAGWRTWLGNARRFSRPSQASRPRHGSPHDGLLAGFQRAASRR